MNKHNQPKIAGRILRKINFFSETIIERITKTESRSLRKYTLFFVHFFNLVLRTYWYKWQTKNFHTCVSIIWLFYYHFTIQKKTALY